MNGKQLPKRLLSLFLTVILLACSLLSVSCGKIKDITPYRETFEALIEESFEINEILFGEGLPVYSREESLGELYYSEEKNAEFLAYFKAGQGKDFPEQLYTDNEGKFRIYYWTYRDPVLTKSTGENIYVCKYRVTYYLPEGMDDEGNPEYDMVNETFYALKRDTEEAMLPKDVPCGDLIYKTSEGVCYYALGESYIEPTFDYEYDEKDNEFYDVVRVDGTYMDISSIKAAAEAVYSLDYLTDVYSSVFDGIRSDYTDSSSSVLLARYIEEASEDGGTPYLRKSNVVEPLFTEQRTYYYDTMQIVKPYNTDRVNVTIEAEGTYFSSETMKVETGRHTVRLSFVLQDGAWRLDSPTY